MTADKPIAIASPRFGPESERLVLEVLRSGRTSQGPMVERFEDLGAHMAGTDHAVAMANGTVTLEATLETMGIGPGDEVITAPLTFAATLNAILRSGATARFADVANDMTVDPDSIRSLIGPRTAAILPVHLYGLPAAMPAIMQLASAHGLAVIEDAAQAHGASIDGKPVGGFGVGSFSFYATKNVSAGEGGVVTTSDGDLAQRLRVLRNQGMEAPYEYVTIGRNLRLSELQAAVAIPQLELLADLVSARTRNAAALTRFLADSPAVVPAVPRGRFHAWHVYTVLVDENLRDRAAAEIGSRGVEARIYYGRLVWDHPVYRDHDRVARDETPAAADVARRCISLPVHDGLTEAQVQRIAETFLRSLA